MISIRTGYSLMMTTPIRQQPLARTLMHQVIITDPAYVKNKQEYDEHMVARTGTQTHVAIPITQELYNGLPQEDGEGSLVGEEDREDCHVLGEAGKRDEYRRIGQFGVDSGLVCILDRTYYEGERPRGFDWTLFVMDRLADSAGPPRVYDPDYPMLRWCRGVRAGGDGLVEVLGRWDDKSRAYKGLLLEYQGRWGK